MVATVMHMQCVVLADMSLMPNDQQDSMATSTDGGRWGWSPSPRRLAGRRRRGSPMFGRRVMAWRHEGDTTDPALHVHAHETRAVMQQSHGTWQNPSHELNQGAHV